MVEVYVPNWADSNIGNIVAAIIIVAIIAASVIALSAPAIAVAITNAVTVAVLIIIIASHCVICKIAVAVCKCIAILTDVLHRLTHLEVQEVTLPQIKVSWKGTILTSIYFLTVPVTIKPPIAAVCTTYPSNAMYRL
jgi:hypothetical protein